MDIVVFSFRKPAGAHPYTVMIDNGDGLKPYEVKHLGEYYQISVPSPIGFINSYLTNENAELLQVVEESGYDHLRFYLKKPVD